MKTDIILHIKGLSASFVNQGRRTEVLHNLDIPMIKGETLGIVGESGSGKSVTSLSIMGLIPRSSIEYSSGQILFQKEEVDLLRLDDTQIRALRGKSIAMIFQEPMTSLNPLKRCGAQVEEALMAHVYDDKHKASKEVLELFQKVKLPDPERAYSSYPHELSGGQKQRVMIAMAISCKPQLLIADEPTTALDVTVQREIIALLKELQLETGMSMIFISHDLALVSHIADKLVVMKGGKILEQGSAKRILHDPKNSYTKGLLASRPPADTRPIRLATVSDYLDSRNIKIEEVDTESRESHHQKLYKQSCLIQVEALHTWYPVRQGLLGRTKSHVKAVNGVSLDLHLGETLGIVGESGCGKSTLGRTIIGLESPRSGSIKYKGVDIQSMDSAQRNAFTREVQMIFQDPYSSLNPKVRIGDAVREPMEVYGLHGSTAHRKERTVELLEKVGLQAEHCERYPHEFSGGQRQRICIARTLALEPRILICDESVSALDVSVQAQVLNLLNELKEEFELSYLFISHDLSVVRYMSDKVIVMNHGEVIEYREADDLYNDPKEAYTKKLISSAYTLESDEVKG